jgi:hypothetical protein
MKKRIRTKPNAFYDPATLRRAECPPDTNTDRGNPPIRKTLRHRQVSKFLIGLISEPDKKPSFARVLSAIIVLIVLGLVMFSTIHNGRLPDLNSATLFVTGGVGTLYGSNKIAAAIDSK